VSCLIDANIISEIRKGPRCDPRVAEWFASIDSGDVYLSVLVLGEIRNGIERARAKGARQGSRARELARNRARLIRQPYPFNQRGGRRRVGKDERKTACPTVDALLAATAKVHRLSLATRGARRRGRRRSRR
jgi:toxin FitB